MVNTDGAWRFTPGTPLPAAEFFSRWITHLCAPTFVLLAGLGVGLRRIRGAATGDVAWFLFTRGLWLVAAELTVFRLVIWWNVDLSFLAFLQVIWAIGWSMIALAALVHLPRAWIAGIGIAIVAGHNLLDPVTFPAGAPGHALWAILHDRGFIDLRS